MNSPEQSIKLLRKQMKGYLKDWIPNNNNLVKKELEIFDSIMTRRDFLKTTSLAALSVLIGYGCNKPPSQWEDDGSNSIDWTISDSDMSTVTTPCNIAVDSEIQEAFTTYTPLPAVGSEDSTIISHSIMESFNPHIMTASNEDEITSIGLNLPTRTYGIPEHLHLEKQSNESDYNLSIYEKDNDGHQGLKQTIIKLKDTSLIDYDSIVATNGSFHNKIKDNFIHKQKMVLLSNKNDTHDYSQTSALRLYYRTEFAKLLLPDENFISTTNWDNYIDLIKEFKNQEPTASFNSYKIAEINTYTSGDNHSFIYGTIRFDNYYNYGFVISYDDFTQIDVTNVRPAITFFSAQFMSYNSEGISNLIKDYNDNSASIVTPLSDILIFSKANFTPLAQLVDDEGNLQSKFIFSFYCLSAMDETVSNTSGYDLLKFSNINSDFVKRYPMLVEHKDVASSSVVYTLDDYDSFGKIEIASNQLHFSFSVYKEHEFISTDIWESIYNKQTNKVDHMFVRSIKSNGSNYEVLTSSTHYSESNMEFGLSHHTIEIDLNTKISVNNVYSNNILFEDMSSDDGKYKDLWFNNILSGYSSLYDCVHKKGGIGTIDFHATHNHQGLLRNYLLIRYSDEKSILLGCNEKGIEETTKFAYQNHDNIINKLGIEHYPPMPISIDNPLKLFHWHGIAEDGEVLYSSIRQNEINSNNQLIENSNKNLLSYMHSSCNLTQKVWNMREEQIHVDFGSDTIETNLVKNDLHQVHLHVTNCYRNEVSLYKNTQLFSNLSDDQISQVKEKEANADIYVEIRFNKRVSIKDYTDITNIKTYHPSANNSIFLSTDSKGKVSLQIDAGTKDDKYNGAIMQYRLIDKSNLIKQSDKALAIVTNDSNSLTTDFKSCNISFKTYQKLSTQNYDNIQIGASKDSDTAKTVLDNINSSSSHDISHAFSKVLENTSPNNDSQLVRLNKVQINNNNLLALGFSSSVTHFKAVNWIRHSIYTASSNIEKLLEAAKQAASTLSKDITTIISNITDDIDEAIEDIAAAVEKLWNDVSSFAQKLWDILRTVLDFKTAYNIGQELKQLRFDQLKPLNDSNSQNIYSHNAYTIMESAEDMVSEISDDMIEKIDTSLDAIFGNNIKDISQKMDTHKTNVDNDKKNMQNNSTIITHIVDQIDRLIELLKINKLIDYVKGEEEKFKDDLNTLMNNIFGVTLDEMLSGSFPKYLEDNLLSFFKVDSKEQLVATIEYHPGLSNGDDPAPNSLIRQIQKNIFQSKNSITNFATGSSSAVDMFNDTQSTIYGLKNLLTSEIENFNKFGHHLPTEFLKDDKIFSFMTQSGDLLNKIFKPLGTLLFLDSHKFKNIEDLATFGMGFSLFIAPIIAESTINEANKVLSKPIDFQELFLDSSNNLRNKFNEYIGYSGAILESILNNTASSNNLTSNSNSIDQISGIFDSVSKLAIKHLGIIIDIIQTILGAISTFFGLVSNIPIKKPISDGLSSIFMLFSGIMELIKIPVKILDIKFAEDAKKSKSEIAATVASAISSSIVYVLNFVDYIFQAIYIFVKGQPGDNATYDPTNVAALAVCGFIIAGTVNILFSLLAFSFNITKLIISLGVSGISDLLIDAEIGGVVILEILSFIAMSSKYFLDISQMIFGYIGFSFFVKAILASETGVALIAYLIVIGAYAVLWISSKIMGFVDVGLSFLIHLSEASIASK
ncbi:hypothetical protein [Halarcobacter sp.]|uniref:hypothetical protein n=1 Tax=Halarcobacter sp. TaxID=2321133 RepID=UPI002AA7E748|nr:hypothetical protein [Halarcobacter sp.]